MQRSHQDEQEHFTRARVQSRTSNSFPPAVEEDDASSTVSSNPEDEQESSQTVEAAPERDSPHRSEAETETVQPVETHGSAIPQAISPFDLFTEQGTLIVPPLNLHHLAISPSALAPEASGTGSNEEGHDTASHTPECPPCFQPTLSVICCLGVVVAAYLLSQQDSSFHPL